MITALHRHLQSAYIKHSAEHKPLASFLTITVRRKFTYRRTEAGGSTLGHVSAIICQASQPYKTIGCDRTKN